MPNTSHLSGDKFTAAQVKVYMPLSMRDELFDRSEHAAGEGTNVSRIVRTAIREYFRRHPRSRAKAP